MTKPKRNRGRHRVPPKPHHMHKANRGFCKFCGGTIMKNGKLNRRATWHPECALKWTIMNSPRDARRFVFVRDRGICRACGTNCQPDGADPAAVAKIIETIMSPPGETMTTRFHTPIDLGPWELDHILPLNEAVRIGSPPELWQMSNMATLCHGCHVAKTKLDRIIYPDEDEKRDRRSIRTTADAIAALELSGFKLDHASMVVGA